MVKESEELGLRGGGGERERGNMDFFHSPTVEGSLTAVGRIFNGNSNGGSMGVKEELTEEELRRYWLGGIGNFRYDGSDNGGSNNNNIHNNTDDNNLLFSKRVGFNGNGMNEGQNEWNGGVGLPGLALGTQQKSIVEIIQDDLNHSSSDGGNIQGNSLNPNTGVSASLSYASALGGSLSRSTTPDPQIISRAQSPHILAVGEGRVNSMDIRRVHSPNSLHQHLSNLHIDPNHVKQGLHLDTSEFGSFHQPKGSFPTMGKDGGVSVNQNYYLREDKFVDRHKHGGPNSPSYFHSIGSPSSSIPNYSLSGHNINPALGSMMAGPVRSAASPPGNLMAAARLAALNDPFFDGCVSYMDFLTLQKAYLGSLISPRKSESGRSYAETGLNNGYYGNQAYGIGSAYGGSPLVSSMVPNSPMGLGCSLRHGERNMRLLFGSSLLDELKSNKTICFDLSGIAGHVVEFSADQYGSRFIQQKLETATSEEKDMVFHEIFPQALSLMTDVFGNYVIQKFFEHGTTSQIRELADKLTGHVLTLSLQMYGCRVIQKAIEVADLDQQKKMVVELDGHIMRCVRDQNGNHVIQKCIECIPEDAIHFIISTFYDHIVTLSTHPYGCRVIQRVLEHCHDQTTQRIVMEEIMQSACMLAQDQYGNYVVQHVLEHGKPHERSAIICKLTGKIVQMSQQKFASNVIEKCLAFGDATERRTMVNEILGSTDEYEPLQVMMKDQFANYVIQKVLETCDDQQLEVILSRIKDHLNALKKYTYGKHIVARVEKLVAAGERRISLQNAFPATMA